MIILISIILVVALAVAAYHIVNFLDKDVPTTDNDVPTYTQQELDNIELAEELYNKDLRPVVAKKAKTKPAPELEVVEAEFVEKVVDIAKVFPEDATINLEGIKPVKKKRKYYPKNKK
jgi:hypothetical protein